MKLIKFLIGKEEPKALSLSETMRIEMRLLPRWSGKIPDILKDAEALKDFRKFSAQTSDDMNKICTAK